MTEFTLAAGDEVPPLFYILRQAHLAASTSEARRLIEQGAVRLDGAPQTDPKHQLPRGKAVLVQSGKRRFARVTVT